MDGFAFLDELNAIEICLLIDTCLKNAPIEELKNKAKTLAQQIIDKSDREDKKIQTIKIV